jgi:hypothetical protein
MGISLFSHASGHFLMLQHLFWDVEKFENQATKSSISSQKNVVHSTANHGYMTT